VTFECGPDFDEGFGMYRYVGGDTKRTRRATQSSEKEKRGDITLG
jgi:hypothetical protein